MFNYAWRRVDVRVRVRVVDACCMERTSGNTFKLHPRFHALRQNSKVAECSPRQFPRWRRARWIKSDLSFVIAATIFTKVAVGTVARPIATVFRVSLRFRRACSGASPLLHQAFARPKRARPGTSRGSRVGEGRSKPPRRRGRSGPVMSRWGAAPARKSNLKSNRPPAREEDKTKEYMNPGRGPNGLLISTLGT